MNISSKHRYHDIAIPPELDAVVERALAAAPRPPRRIRFRTVWRVAALVAVGVLVLLNTGATLARAAEAFPALMSFARLITATEYTRSPNRDDLISVRLPALIATGNVGLEERVNAEIKRKMDAAIADAETRARETRAARVATGGDPDEGPGVYIDIDYELEYNANGIVSFVVNKTETLASAYTEQLFYNLELATGRELKLPDLLGPDFRAIADAAIRRQMQIRIQEDDAMYFDGRNGFEGFQGVTADQKFYINKRGNVVAVFAKYEIAPGCMGIQEFEIPTPPVKPPANSDLAFIREIL